MILIPKAQWRSNNDLVQCIKPQEQGREFRIDQLGEQVRLGSQFYIVACFRIQISSAKQFKTRLDTKREPFANTKRFRASGPDKQLKGEIERNTQTVERKAGPSNKR